MHICFLANAASVHTQRWARHFTSRGYHVTVVSFQRGEIKGISVIHLPVICRRFHLNIFLNLAKIRRLVQEIDPDILHAHYATSYGLSGALTGKHPYVITAWGSDVLIMPEQSWVYRQIVRFAMRRADLITSMASHMTNYLIEKNLSSANKIITLPFGTDTVLFNPNLCKQKHSAESPVIISNRRLDVGLDVDLFIKAVPEVIKLFPDALFIVASDGTERSKIEKLALKLGVNTHIEFRGQISYPDMPLLLSNADVFVSTSPSDGNNISLCEAMACGVFPVATDIPANRDWVRSGHNGLLFPMGDYRNLSKCIIDALRKPEWRESIISYNYNVILEKGSWEKNMAVMINEYDKLISRYANLD